MSTFEDSYSPQLAGVSQQIARERGAGQLAAQDNMLSDTVTNLRRRPGAVFLAAIDMAGTDADHIVAWDTEIGGQRVQVVLQTTTGVLRVFDRDFVLLYTSAAKAYLVQPDINKIQVATVGDEFFLCNLSVPVTTGPTLLDPTDYGQRGYLAFPDNAAGWYAFIYKPQPDLPQATYFELYANGSEGAGNVFINPNSSIDIATYFTTQINGDTVNSHVTAVREGSAIFLSTPPGYTFLAERPATVYTSFPLGDPPKVWQNMPYQTSGNGYVASPADLPNVLPAAADGMLMATGNADTPVYYRYESTTEQWLESGDADSPTYLAGTPISLYLAAGVWGLDESPFDGRSSGDEFTNPTPNFVKMGITGMGSYHGRLVLLAGPLICMSAAGAPRQFYRGTITQILDGDPISVGASAASSAAWRYAMQFESDLLLFSEKYQGAIVGTSQAITPRTANVAVTSSYAADVTTKPVTVGRTLVYPMERSRDFFGMLEMAQSQTSEGKRTYISDDITAHLPRYMAGRCRLMAASSTANMALFQPTGDRQSLVVYEYIWEGDRRVQAAWHKWTFAYPVALCYFVGQSLRIGFYQNGKLVVLSMDPRGSRYSDDGELMAFLDFGVFADVEFNVIDVPAWMTAFDPLILPKLRAASVDTGLAGEPIGVEVDGAELRTITSFVEGRVSIGLPYTSMFSPTPPMRKDDAGVKISSNKMTVLRFMLGTSGTGDFDVAITDATAGGTEAWLLAEPQAALTFSSPELSLGQALDAEDSISIIPARTQADSTSLVVSTAGIGELNMVSLEFVARYHEKIKRIRKK